MSSARMIALLAARVVEYISHRIASNVVEKALRTEEVLWALTYGTAEPASAASAPAVRQDRSVGRELFEHKRLFFRFHLTLQRDPQA